MVRMVMTTTFLDGRRSTNRVNPYFTRSVFTSQSNNFLRKRRVLWRTPTKPATTSQLGAVFSGGFRGGRSGQLPGVPRERNQTLRFLKENIPFVLKKIYSKLSLFSHFQNNQNNIVKFSFSLS
jgi:hypothetical protein